MKFWAKVEFKGEENASELVLAFFKEFNPESSIVIQGKQAKVEILFDSQPPIETIQAIQRCRVEEFYYGKILGEYIQEENQLVDVEQEAVIQPKEVEQEIVPQLKEVEEEVTIQPEEVEQEAEIQHDDATPQEEIPKQLEPTPEKRRRKSTKKVESNHKEVDEKVEILELEEISKNATSFENFVNLVAEWLEMEKMQSLFENLVMVAIGLEKVTWNNLEAVLASKKNIIINQYHKICIGKKVSEKLNKYSITTILLINAMKQYKDYEFEQQSSAENPVIESVAEEVAVVKEETPAQVEEVTEKKRVKMECMPEIIYFEEILGAVDKTQPIEDRVKYVLNSMGLKNKSVQEQQGILEIANVAVTLEKIEWDIIFSKSSQPTEYLMNARMYFSKFINEYVCEYNRNTNVKVLTFLKQVQEIVINESEMESLTGSTN